MLSLEERNDNWQNLLSGLGTARDKSSYTHLSPNDRFPPDYLEQLYLSDDIAARICDLVPHEMLRLGIDTVPVNNMGQIRAFFNAQTSAGHSCYFFAFRATTS